MPRSSSNAVTIQVPVDFEYHLARAGLSPEDLQAVRSILGLSMPTRVGTATRAIAKARARFSLPDADGHMLWSGPMPANRARPQIMVDGTRYDAARFLRKCLDKRGWDGVGDGSLVRDTSVCAVDRCFAPDHFKVIAIGQPEGPTRDYAGLTIYAPALLDLYTQAWPKPRSGRLGSYRVDASMQAYCPIDHPCVGYGGVRKSGYCATCEATLVRWRAALRDWNDHVRRDGLNYVEARILRCLREDPNDAVRIATLWRSWSDRVHADRSFAALNTEDQYDQITGRVLASPSEYDFSGLFEDESPAQGSAV